jgi:RNA polymerase sigma-70 factor (sigma-E family)
VRARSPALSRTAYLLTGDHHLAQDLLQSALAATYQHWPRVRDGNPEAYVRRALHNTYVSWWRRKPPAQPVADVSVAPTTDGTEATLRRLTILNALRVLTPRQRAVIVLRYFEDLTEAETAAILGCAVGTVKSQTRHALTRLRQLAPDLAGLRGTAPEVTR